jgi:hypothetical protein
LAYTEQFRQFSNDSQLEAARACIRTRLREGSRATSEAEQAKNERQIEYDTVMMLNLCPRTVRDARSFITSLSGKTDDQIESLLKELDRFRG